MIKAKTFGYSFCCFIVAAAAVAAAAAAARSYNTRILEKILSLNVVPALAIEYL